MPEDTRQTRQQTRGSVFKADRYRGTEEQTVAIGVQMGDVNRSVVSDSVDTA